MVGERLMVDSLKSLNSIVGTNWSTEISMSPVLSKRRNVSLDKII